MTLRGKRRLSRRWVGATIYALNAKTAFIPQTLERAKFVEGEQAAVLSAYAIAVDVN